MAVSGYWRQANISLIARIVGFWHKADIPVPSVDVLFRGQTGKHLFTLSLTAADHERLETWYHPSIA